MNGGPTPVIQDDLVISRLILSCKVLFKFFPPIMSHLQVGSRELR